MPQLTLAPFQPHRRKDDSEHLPPLLSLFPSIMTGVEDLFLATLPFGSPIVPARAGVGAGAGSTGIFGPVPGLDEVNVIAGALVQRGTAAAGSAFALAPAPSLQGQSQATTTTAAAAAATTKAPVRVNVLVEEEISCVQLGGTSRRNAKSSAPPAAISPPPSTSMPAAAVVEVHGQVMCAESASSSSTSVSAGPAQKSRACEISLEITGTRSIVGESVCRGARMRTQKGGESSSDVASATTAEVLLLGSERGFQRVMRYRALPPQSNAFGPERPLSFLPVTASYAARSTFCTGTPEYVDIELRLLVKLNFGLDEGARVEQFCAYLPLPLPPPPCEGVAAGGATTATREYMASSHALEASCGVLRLTPDGRGVRWWPAHPRGGEQTPLFLAERGGCLQGTVRFHLEPSPVVEHARAMQRERARRDAFARQMQRDADGRRRGGRGGEAATAGAGGGLPKGKPVSAPPGTEGTGGRGRGGAVSSF